MFGIAFLVFIVATIFIILTDKTSPVVIAREERKKAAIEASPEYRREKKLKEQRALEARQKHLASLKGLDKYYDMDQRDAFEYRQGIEAMRQLGMIMQQSVYQEKEQDWALFGGIADGIAGPAAGVATAVDIMQKNAQIRADNQARREWGLQQKRYMDSLAANAEAKQSQPLSKGELKERFRIDYNWSPLSLFSKLSFETKIEVDQLTGAVTIIMNWKQADSSVCIDGALRAKIYTATGDCVGCAYMILPKIGTAKQSGSISGICVEPIKKSMQYTVKIVPIDLWELAFTKEKNPSLEKVDSITKVKRTELLEKLEAEYQAERAKVTI